MSVHPRPVLRSPMKYTARAGELAPPKASLEFGGFVAKYMGDGVLVLFEVLKFPHLKTCKGLTASIEVFAELFDDLPQPVCVLLNDPKNLL